MVKDHKSFPPGDREKSKLLEELRSVGAKRHDEQRELLMAVLEEQGTRSIRCAVLNFDDADYERTDYPASRRRDRDSTDHGVPARADTTQYQWCLGAN